MIRFKPILTSELEQFIIDLKSNSFPICCAFFIATCSFLVYNNSQSSFSSSAIFYCLISLLFAVLLYVVNKNFLTKIVLCVICAALFAMIFLSHHNNYQKIQGNLFANISGEIIDYHKIDRSRSKRFNYRVILKNIEITKPIYNKKKKNTSKKKVVSSRYVTNNYQNLKNYSDIDSKHVDERGKYYNPKWSEVSGKYFFDKPAKYIQVFLKSDEDLSVGDIIKADAMIAEHQSKSFFRQYDHSFYLLANSIANNAYATKKVELLSYSKDGVHINSTGYFAKLRKGIFNKIYQLQSQQENSAVIEALLLGNKKNIDSSYYKVIKDSGLAHLVSISGLHMSLAAGIFFILFRFVLSRSEYLLLRWDVKKISAILSIFAAYVYLNIANMPISAIRAFLAISFFMIAILLDRKISALRMVFLAALIIVIINPFYVFFIGYQLSFSSVIAIICTRKFAIYLFQERFSQFFQSKTTVANFSKYFLEVVMISLATQIFTLPFLIYHFGNFPLYSIVSNISAIPIVSFVTMPIGFISLFLMIFDCHEFALIAMSKSIDLIFFIASSVTKIKHSVVDYDYYIQSHIMIIIVILLLIFSIFSSHYIKIITIAVVAILIIKVDKENNYPNILIDSKGSHLALFDRDNGLLFPRKVRSSKRVNLWLDKLPNRYRDSASLNSKKSKGLDCDKRSCVVDLAEYFNNSGLMGKKLLSVHGRYQVSQICNQRYDIVINLTRKYELADCLIDDNIVIDNSSILDKGGHYIFIDKGGKMTIYYSKS